MPSDMMIGTVLVGIGEQCNSSVIFLLSMRYPNSHLDSHMDASEFEADIIRGFDWIILASHRAQIEQNIFPRGRRGPGIASSLDQHLLELHEDVGIEVSEAQHSDNRGDGGRRRAFLLQTLLRYVERLRDKRRKLVMNHPAHRRELLRLDAQHIDRVLRVTLGRNPHSEALQVGRTVHDAACRLHEEIQRVEIGGHRERAVHTDVRITRHRHATQSAEPLCVVETWKPNDVAGENDEALSGEREKLAEHGDGADGQQNGAVLWRNAMGGEKYGDGLTIQRDGLLQRGIVGLHQGLRHLRELPRELHARDEIDGVGGVAARDGEQSALERSVFDANGVVAEIAEDVVRHYKERVRNRLLVELLVAQLEFDLCGTHERGLRRGCSHNRQPRSLPRLRKRIR